MCKMEKASLMSTAESKLYTNDEIPQTPLSTTGIAIWGDQGFDPVMNDGGGVAVDPTCLLVGVGRECTGVCSIGNPRPIAAPLLFETLSPDHAGVASSRRLRGEACGVIKVQHGVQHRRSHILSAGTGTNILLRRDEDLNHLDLVLIKEGDQSRGVCSRLRGECRGERESRVSSGRTIQCVLACAGLDDTEDLVNPGLHDESIGLAHHRIPGDDRREAVRNSVTTIGARSTRLLMIVFGNRG